MQEWIKEECSTFYYFNFRNCFYIMQSLKVLKLQAFGASTQLTRASPVGSQPWMYRWNHGEINVITCTCLSKLYYEFVDFGEHWILIASWLMDGCLTKTRSLLAVVVRLMLHTCHRLLEHPITMLGSSLPLPKAQGWVVLTGRPVAKEIPLLSFSLLIRR